MGRWRPPQPKSSKYITQSGYEKLNAELRHLWKEKRPQVTLAVREAAAQGDRSDNAEYTEGKRLLREIDRRVRFLANRLEDITVVNNIPQNTQIVLFGAWVTLIDENDKELKVRIVGPDEIDAKNNYISMDSPLAKALLKKTIDDEISLKKPDNSVIYYEITEIKYEKYS